jgi:hypothetical protein
VCRPSSAPTRPSAAVSSGTATRPRVRVGRVSGLNARALTLTAHGHSYPLRDAPLFRSPNRGPCGTSKTTCATAESCAQTRMPPRPDPDASTIRVSSAATAAGPRPPRALQAPSRTLSLVPRPPQHAVRACTNARRLHLHTRATGPAFLLMPAERVQGDLCRTGWCDAQRSTEACSNTYRARRHRP